jgi:hypothetical protein
MVAIDFAIKVYRNAFFNASTLSVLSHVRAGSFFPK